MRSNSEQRAGIERCADGLLCRQGGVGRQIFLAEASHMKIRSRLETLLDRFACRWSERGGTLAVEAEAGRKEAEGRLGSVCVWLLGDAMPGQDFGLCCLPLLHAREGLCLLGRDILQQHQVHKNDQRAFHQLRSHRDAFAVGRAKEIVDKLAARQAVYSQFSNQSLACMARQSNAS